LKDNGRRDYTLNSTTLGPTNGVQFSGGCRNWSRRRWASWSRRGRCGWRGRGWRCNGCPATGRGRTRTTLRHKNHNHDQ